MYFGGTLCSRLSLLCVSCHPNILEINTFHVIFYHCDFSLSSLKLYFLRTSILHNIYLQWLFPCSMLHQLGIDILLGHPILSVLAGYCICRVNYFLLRQNIKEVLSLYLVLSLSICLSPSLSIYLSIYYIYPHFSLRVLSVSQWREVFAVIDTWAFIVSDPRLMWWMHASICGLSHSKSNLMDPLRPKL